MGSFMSQLYITRYDDLDGLILSGSTKAAALVKVGSVLAKVLNALSRDKTKPSPFMNAMAFGSYNKAFKNPRTDFDWLSRDARQVDKYIRDPYCGGICSISFYANLTGGMAAMGKRKGLEKINRQLPIYIQGGSMDPVSDMGKGLYALKKQYADLGVCRLELDVYEGARHEIFNELNRQEVYQNTLRFIQSLIRSGGGEGYV
jgi:alpha-beta hydrolase superfamily lysophospholipase